MVCVVVVVVVVVVCVMRGVCVSLSMAGLCLVFPGDANVVFVAGALDMLAVLKMTAHANRGEAR
jgi:hypothetical protein